MTQERFYWIDYAKVIGIFLVVLGHIHLQNKFYTDFIFSFHIPLFFFVSGFLFKSVGEFKADFKKSFRTLLIPYFWFYVLSYFIWLEGFIRHPELFPDRSYYAFFVKPMAGMVLAVGYDTPHSIMANVPLWFLPGLFFCRMIFSLLLKFSKRGNTAMSFLIVALVALLVILELFDKVPLFSIGSAVMALPFFYAGYLLKNSRFQPSNISRNMLGFILAAGFTVTVLLAWINGYVDMNYVNFGKSPILFYIGGATGTVMVLTLSMMIDRFRHSVINFVSANTLTIFAIHLPILLFTLEIFGHFVESEPHPGLHSLPYSVIVSFIVLASCGVPVVIIDRYFPFILGKNKEKAKALPA